MLKGGPDLPIPPRACRTFPRHSFEQSGPGPVDCNTGSERTWSSPPLNDCCRGRRSVALLVRQLGLTVHTHAPPIVELLL